MTTIETLLHDIRTELTPQLEARLREQLADRDRAWLIDQIVRLCLGAEYVQDQDRVQHDARLAQERQDRIGRLQSLRLDAARLAGFIEEFRGWDQARLVSAGYLLSGHPARGTALLTTDHRSHIGEMLLEHAKDVLFGLLYGDEATGTFFDRCEREILTMTLPRTKAHPLAFLKATTELQAHGTWRDPASVSHDERADNVLVQVEFGETADEQIGSGLVAALGLINNLEINEQILYAQMVNVEQSTLSI